MLLEGSGICMTFCVRVLCGMSSMHSGVIYVNKHRSRGRGARRSHCAIMLGLRPGPHDLRNLDCLRKLAWNIKCMGRSL